MAGVTGLRDVRYGVGDEAGKNHCFETKDVESYFTYDPSMYCL